MKCCKKWLAMYCRIIRLYPNAKDKFNFCPHCKKELVDYSITEQKELK